MENCLEMSNKCYKCNKMNFKVSDAPHYPTGHLEVVSKGYYQWKINSFSTIWNSAAVYCPPVLPLLRNAKRDHLECLQLYLSPCGISFIGGGRLPSDAAVLVVQKTHTFDLNIELSVIDSRSQALRSFQFKLGNGWAFEIPRKSIDDQWGELVVNDTLTIACRIL